MNEKMKEIVQSDFTTASFWLSKIQATALSAYSYLDEVLRDSNRSINEQINNTLYMFDVIKDLSKATDDILSEIGDKIISISQEMEETA
ncbi:MAG: hypothetical protein K2J11_01895 [Oscillospiraceae bacterium]|nr:hypothetical protein [Oscillospiraceae bacterium]